MQVKESASRTNLNAFKMIKNKVHLKFIMPLEFTCNKNTNLPLLAFIFSLNSVILSL